MDDAILKARARTAPFRIRALIILNKLWIQLSVSALITVAAWQVVQTTEPSRVRALLDPTFVVTALGVIGGILALAGSVAFGHLLSFGSDATSRKHDAYHRLKEQFAELHDFALLSESQDPLLEVLPQVVEELRAKRLDDLPLMDWDERIAPIEPFLAGQDLADADDVLRHQVLMKLEYCEDLLSTVGLMTVKQVVARVLLDPVLKCFGVTAALLMSTVLGFFLLASPFWYSVFAVMPVFFALLTAFLFVELGYWVKRSVDELYEPSSSEEAEEKDGATSHGSARN